MKEYSLECPKELFVYFIRKLYPEIEVDNSECIELGEEFYKYLNAKNFTKEQQLNILPKNTFDVILNSTHPFRNNGFPLGYVLHFTEFIEEMKNKNL